MSTTTLPTSLIAELEQIVGKGAVYWRPEDLLVYEYDGTIDRGRPSVIALPDSTEQVAALVRLANRYGLPIVPRGAGTGLSGGALATEGGIVMPTTRMRRVLHVDPVNRLAIVEPGLVNLELSRAVARHGLFYARYFRRAVAGYTDRKGKKHPGALPAHLHGLRFHDLRHTCAALSIAAGAHPKLIAARLGHSTVQITLDRYGHLFPSVEEALAEALDAAFTAAETQEPSTNVVEMR